jgi:hypothetical protein
MFINTLLAVRRQGSTSVGWLGAELTTIVVGGHSRNVGKTSVTAGLIHAFKSYPWTAIKISSHRHSNIQISAHPGEESVCDIYEETDRMGSSDTSRFLAAGASRSLWMQIKRDPSKDVMRQLLPILRSSSFVMIESNQIVRLMQPDLFVMVLRYDIEEFKASARSALRQANAIVAVNPDSSPPPWDGISEILSGIPQFVTADPKIIPPEFVDFVRLRLQQSELH